MGFAQAISAGFSYYVNFRDRACRSEYWYWILFIIIADIVAGTIDAVLGIQIVTGLFGLVEFPAPGMWSLVFLTQPPSPPIAAHLPQTEHISAFLPCTPNPTTGFFFYVPRADVIDLDITVEQAMSLLISAGIIQPGVEDPHHRLAALAETARAAQAAHKEATPAK